MTYYDGLVEDVTDDDRATVFITPGKEGKPRIHEARNEGCHCVRAGEGLKITAVNKAHARVGDWVLVGQQRGALAQNASNILGIPLLGAMFGAALGGVWTDGVGLSATVITAASGGLLLGILLGWSRYRRSLPETQPYVEKVVQRREESPHVLYAVKR